ncbi:hypothetical protein A2924_00405 [Candidatus Giovannonibacteria bacterium RIFCSPLOWO2_01_FULL_44_16]|uniref:Uncharacterized protein n=1 Tax=Candidatus Giovannonibacteria bacterium RIFCSPLOWO2_01_FULL_44_16 TaxID=1798348 RepID=A0A1F5X2J9_9BACT|nr:MAG: hypothetical protein A2924_00405 [Candidatus Giovannonibacteria bacterium RIFCSPLOWO2_01_FULL_44_16]
MLREEIKQQTKGYIMAGLGLVAGLAWNEAIKSLIEYLYPLDQGSLLAKFVYAVLITVFVVVFSTYLFGPEEKNK